MIMDLEILGRTKQIRAINDAQIGVRKAEDTDGVFSRVNAPFRQPNRLAWELGAGRFGGLNHLSSGIEHFLLSSVRISGPDVLVQ